MTSSDANYFPKASVPNTIPLEVKNSTYEFEGHISQSIAVSKTQEFQISVWTAFQAHARCCVQAVLSNPQ